MKVIKLFSSLSLSVLALAMVSGCDEGATAKKSGALVQPLADGTVVMKYNGGTITAKELNEMLKPQFQKMEEEVREAYKRGSERMLLTKLLQAEAKKQGLPSPEALMQKMAANSAVSDDQVNEFFKTNKLDKGVPDPKTGKLRKVSKDEIRNYLAGQEQQQKQQAFLQGLMSQAKAEMVLEEPRTNVKLVGTEPFQGGANAKVVIQEFSDFECPFCSRAKNVVSQIHQQYGDKVKIVFRNFPLEFHANAMPSAVAAACAHRQGKFWALHDKFFDNQKELGGENILKFAKDSGLDMAKFEPCFKNSETSGDIKKDISAAEEIGVNSTPTFFVNGKRLAGALPFEQFKTLIDSELNKM